RFQRAGSNQYDSYFFRIGEPPMHPALAWFDGQEWNSWELTTAPVTGHGRDVLATELGTLQPGSYRITLIGPGQQPALFDFDEAGE
ncbi:hypothetical protein ACI3PL_26020, partial [Lacticaseibacillus paracasei]